MITIIAATNRPGSRTLPLANYYKQEFSNAGADAALFSLTNFASWHRDASFEALEAQYLLPASKYVFILPEYNGSIPGVFKLMMDLCDVKACYNNKKAMLVGLATGRSGNLRGLDVMTNMAHYLRMNVFYNKLPISGIHQLMDDKGHIHDTALQQSIQQQIHEFINY